MLRTARTILCYVTDRRSLAPELNGDLFPSIQAAISAGVDWIQIREKDLPTRSLLDLARKAVSSAAGKNTKILINDRLDVASASGADGVHLGGESAPVADVVHWCRAGNAPHGFLVGASCHNSQETLAAERDGADYLFFGPVFDTPSKLAYGPPQGLDRLAEICLKMRIPVLAIGGIRMENSGDCVRRGAAGIAAIRLFQNSEDLPAIIDSLRQVK
ncbi:MAG: thiamine phosphate synthase [Candidatus Acidiferrales bacterium]